MLNQVLRQFHFTKAERYGAVALLLLVGLLWMTPEVYRRFRQRERTDFTAFAEQVKAYAGHHTTTSLLSPAVTEASLFAFDPNTASVEAFVQLGLSEKVARTIVRYRERGGRFRAPDDLRRIYTLPEADFERLRPYIRIGGERENGYQRKQVSFSSEEPEQAALFPFDPNTASEAELLRLGLPPSIVNRLLRYREKGGFFFEKQDVQKLYGLREYDFKRLEPYIRIRKSDLVARPVSYSGGSYSEPETAIEVNSAAVEHWQRLPGVGAYRAQKIVQYREKLGGFASVDQVGETLGLPDSIFRKIRPRLELKTPVYRKIDLNTSSEAEISAHPYFDGKQARLIVAYRQQHGPFSTAEDIRRIAAFTDRQWLEKALAYVKVE